MQTFKVFFITFAWKMWNYLHWILFELVSFCLIVIFLFLKNYVIITDYQLNTMYQTHKTYPGNNRFQDYLERRLTDLHYHGFPCFGKIKHSLLLFLISISFMSLLPFVHIGKCVYFLIIIHKVLKFIQV